jgi:protein ImuB
VVEETKVDTVVVDASGCELIFGSAYELANEIRLRAQKAPADGGLETKVNVALAANPDAAIHAAKNLEGITFISPGEELTCLGDLQLRKLEHALVQLDEKQADEIFETLRLWGVHLFRDFAALPVTGVSERLGQNGVRLQQLAKGTTERHLKLKQLPRVFAASLELDHAIAELEPLSFVFARLLNQLCASLNAYALATNELLITLKLGDQTFHERKLTLPYAMRDHKVFLKLLLLDTEMHPPKTAVIAVSIKCDPVKPRVLQNGLFIPLAPEPEKLELTLARIAKLVGETNIGSPVLIDTHRPDAFSMKRFVVKSQSDKKRRLKNPKAEIRNLQSTLGFRMFRPPVRAMVQAHQGIPKQVSAWDKHRSIHGKVTSVAGPWRTTGDWWRDDRWARDEWDIAVEMGSGFDAARTTALYRIYRELVSGTWFVEGTYD